MSCVLLNQQLSDQINKCILLSLVLLHREIKLQILRDSLIGKQVIRLKGRGLTEDIFLEVILFNHLKTYNIRYNKINSNKEQNNKA